MDRPPGSPLPAVLAPLIGRAHDLDRLLALLRGGVRLLTLRGPGGIGKTALAQHFAQAVKEDGEPPRFDHVQLIDLSAVRDPERVPGLIAASLPDTGSGGEAAQRIQTFAAHRRILLLLDNFEHLLPAAPVLGDLLAVNSSLQLLVTSRAALRLHDEVEYPVEPLALATRFRDAASSAAVQLFVTRVQAVQPAFALTATTTPQVVRLCEVLEGVPLALELAAVRTRSLSLGDLLARLDHPLQLLKADFRDRPERLRSLRAAVQWSYDLLSEEERAVFECCAVFDGPFTPQALSEVWGSPDVLDRADALLAQSLLQRVDAPETLWKMLQPLRELAVERLEGHPRVDEWRERHAVFFLRLTEEHLRRRQLESGERRGAYLPHYPNIRAGLVWAIEARRSDLAYRYVDAIGMLWIAFGLAAQELPLLDRVLALPAPADRFVLLRALEVKVSLLLNQGQFEVRDVLLHQILELCRELGDEESAALATISLARLELEFGQWERAWGMVQRVMHELRERVGDQPWTRDQLILRANAYMAGSLALVNLDRYEEALEYTRLFFQSLEESGWGAEVNNRGLEGSLLVYTGRLVEGRALLLTCLHDAVSKNLRGIAEVILGWDLTLVAAELRAWTTLVQFVAFVNKPSWEHEQQVYSRRLRQNLGRAREALGEAAYQQAWTSGTQLQLEDVVDLADQLALLPISPVLYPELTPREREVLTLVSQGHPDRKVARLLGITASTASKHVGSLLGKLGLRNRVELARWAIEHTPSDVPAAARPPREGL